MMLFSDRYWEITETKNKGKGLFVKGNVLQGVVIGDYIGKVIRPEDAVVDEENFYLIYYHNRAVISPDLDKPGVHVLNHSCKPNCWLYIYKGHTLVFSMRKIKRGEELTIPYLLPPIDKFCNPCPHVCKCSNKECTGTMHLSKEKYKAWRELTERQSKETKRERIKYGENLRILLIYPKIPQSYINSIKEIL